MVSVLDRYVIARESNVVRVDFRREPDPPAPCFPGANGVRLSHAERDEAEAPAAISVRGAGTSASADLHVWRFQKIPPWHLELAAHSSNSVRG